VLAQVIGSPHAGSQGDDGKPACVYFLWYWWPGSMLCTWDRYDHWTFWSLPLPYN